MQTKIILAKIYKIPKIQGKIGVTDLLNAILAKFAVIWGTNQRYKVNEALILEKLIKNIKKYFRLFQI